MRRRPRPRLLTAPVRELLRDIAVAAAGCAALLALKAVADALPFLIGG